MDQGGELARSFEEAPYARLLGIRVVELTADRARVAMDLRPEHRNSIGMVHGGVIMSLADHAFACVTNASGGHYVAVQFNVNLVSAPAVGTTIYAEGQVLHRGRRAGAAEISVRDSAGKLLARALGTVVNVGAQPG